MINILTTTAVRLFSENSKSIMRELSLGVAALLLGALLGTCTFAQEKRSVTEKEIKVYNDIEEEFPSPFLRAIVTGYTWIVETMLRNGESPNVKDGSEMRLTPILVAAVYRKDDILKLLVKHGAKVDSKDESGMNALLYACERDNLNQVGFLLKAGAQVNSQNSSGLSCQIYAASMGRLSLLKLLLSENADVNLQTERGATPLMVAVDNVDIVETLIKSGAKVDIQDANGRTALYMALLNKDLKKVGVLLRYCAKTDLPDKSGTTPLDMVEEMKNGLDGPAIVRLFKPQLKMKMHVFKMW